MQFILFSQDIKEFKEERCNATISGLNDSLIRMKAVKMLNRKETTKEVCVSALSYLMFLKGKRRGVAKARGYIGSRPEQEYISKGEYSSPTVSSYALFIMCAMESIEGRKFVTCDIPEAFLQAMNF